jgi:hypothetical protein
LVSNFQPNHPVFFVSTHPYFVSSHSVAPAPKNQQLVIVVSCAEQPQKSQSQLDATNISERTQKKTSDAQAKKWLLGSSSFFDGQQSINHVWMPL